MKIMETTIKDIAERVNVIPMKSRSHYKLIINFSMRDFLKYTKEIFRKLCENSNPEQFFTSFYAKVVKGADKLIQFCHHRLCVLVATRLAEKLLVFSKNSLSQNLDNVWKVTEVTEREMGGLQYLAGYVIANLIKKLKLTKNQTISKDVTNQMILILESCTVQDISDQKLIAAQTRGGLTAVNKECQKLFMIAEQTFRVYKSSPHQLTKIQNKGLVRSLLENVKVISYFNSITDCDICSVSVISEKIKVNMLEQIFKLYIRVRMLQANKSYIQTSQRKVFKKK